MNALSAPSTLVSLISIPRATHAFPTSGLCTCCSLCLNFLLLIILHSSSDSSSKRPSQIPLSSLVLTPFPSSHSSFPTFFVAMNNLVILRLCLTLGTQSCSPLTFQHPAQLVKYFHKTFNRCPKHTFFQHTHPDSFPPIYFLHCCFQTWKKTSYWKPSS